MVKRAPRENKSIPHTVRTHTEIYSSRQRHSPLNETYVGWRNSVHKTSSQFKRFSFSRHCKSAADPTHRHRARELQRRLGRASANNISIVGEKYCFVADHCGEFGGEASGTSSTRGEVTVQHLKRDRDPDSQIGLWLIEKIEIGGK
jgi:hypothetical protein